MRSNLASVMLIVWLGENAQAGIIWDETVNGQLSRNNLAPTDFGTLAVGTSTVSGTILQANVDVFKFNVPTGTRLDQIILVRYVSGDNLAFIAVRRQRDFHFVLPQPPMLPKSRM